MDYFGKLLIFLQDSTDGTQDLPGPARIRLVIVKDLNIILALLIMAEPQF